MVLQCWNEHTDKRPSFSDLVVEVSKLLEDIAGYIDFSCLSNAFPDCEDGGYDHLHKNSNDYDNLEDKSTDACTDKDSS